MRRRQINYSKNVLKTSSNIETYCITNNNEIIINKNNNNIEDYIFNKSARIF